MNEGQKYPQESLKAAREKTWDERSDAERIALLRREVMYLRDLVTEHRRQLSGLMYHEHSAMGAVVVSVLHASAQIEEAHQLTGYNRRHDPLA